MKVANKINMQKYKRGAEILGMINAGIDADDTPQRILGDIDYHLRGRGVLEYEYTYAGARIFRQITIPFICITAKDILFYHNDKFRVCNKKKEIDNYLLKWV